MKLLNKVKDKLEKKKGYNFSDEKWTVERLVILHDSVYTTEKVLKKQFKKTEKQRDEMLEMLKEVIEFTKKVQSPSTSAFVLRQEIEKLIEKSKQ